MKRLLWVAVLAVAGASQTTAPGQGRIGPLPPRPDNHFSSGSFGSPHPPHFHPHSLYYWSASGFPGYFGNPYRIGLLNPGTILYYSPPLYSSPAPIVIVSPGYSTTLDGLDEDVIVPRQRRPEVVARPRPVPEAPKAKDPPPREKPPPRPEPAPLPGPAAPAADPRIENARQVKLGQDAFTAGEYGRAERRFQEASEALAEEPVSHFLLAQARFAQGKYQEAVSAIQAGMRLREDWPTVRFSPRELYAVNEVDFSLQLRQLSEAVEKHPRDSFLLFLYAYQLWFDGRRDEARPLFERAMASAAGQNFSQRFLQVR